MDHRNLLGLKVKDAVTGFKGIVTSVTFDLFGCVQALVHPGLNKESLPKDQCWFDVNRLTVINDKPVMAPPTFTTPATYTSSTEKGGAAKPRRNDKPLP